MLSHLSKAKRLLYGIWNEEMVDAVSLCQFQLISWGKVGYQYIWLYLYFWFILYLTDVIKFKTVTITKFSAVIRIK